METFNIEKYITITSSSTVTVSVQVWVSRTTAYHQGAYVQDRNGAGIGTDLIGSTLNGGYLHILAYKDDTNIDVYNSQTGVWVASYNLDMGDSVQANPGNGLWRIQSDKYVSAYSGYGSWNADFAPVEFGEIVVQEVSVDIKPGSCPNPLNLKSKGVLPVAFLGTEDFNVTKIDPETILLSREDGVGDNAPAIRWSYEDVATPFEGEPCDCHELGPDGYEDLTLKFKTQELVEALKLDEVAGQTIPLMLTGNLRESEGGTPIRGADCVWVLDVPRGRR